MNHRFAPLALILLAVCLLIGQPAQSEPVSKADELNWIRYTVPLPKSIQIPDKLILAKGSVAIDSPEDKDVVVEQGVKELYEVLGGRPAGEPAFTVKIITGGFDADPLTKLKNFDQAYRIYPVGKKELRLVAITPTAAYYAAKTLVQLIQGRATADKIEMPLMTVTDWPDLEDRGLWGSDNFLAVKWLADRKMNWMEQISDHGVDEDGVPYARVKGGRETLIDPGYLYGINFVPVVLHLEQSSRRGALQAYPYIKGNSAHTGVMCYSQPKTVWIISKWIAELASLPHVSEVDVWMSENLHGATGCLCDLCKAEKVNPMVLEARAAVKAWRAAQQQLGRRFGLRLLTSEATEDSNTVILSELPKEVKLVYYHSLLTYTCDKRPMMRKYLTDFSKSGGWLATCPNVSAIVLVMQPFESAQFIHYRVKELVDNKCSGILGYATPRVHFCRYNTEATAEYSWNLNGRPTREFAASWAVRNGVKDPEKFAEFREIIGPVEWDINGSEMVYRAVHNRLKPSVAGMLKAGKLPGFGYYTDTFVKAPFGQFTGPKQLDQDVEMADRAMKLAEEIGVEEFIQEVRVNQGFIGSLKSLYELSRLIKESKIAEANKPEAKRYFQMYVDSLRQSIDALPKWETTLLEPQERIGRTNGAVEISEKLIKNMVQVASELGIQVQ